MSLDDITLATFQREAERMLPDDQRREAVAKFAKLKSAEERLAAFRNLRGGSLTAKHATKLGGVPDQA